MQRLNLIILTIFIFVSGVKAQAVFSQTELSRLLDKSETATRQYSETFNNLSAEETKFFEDYDKNGNVKETRRIKSNFIVYQSPRNAIANEFRNVMEFNGKMVARKDEEIAKFFEKLAKAGTDAEEWRKIRNEGVRFDGRSSTWGMTLWQVSPFGNLRPFFEFQIIDTEKIEGRETYVVEYQQIKPTLLIKADPTEDELKKEPGGRQYNTSTPEVFRPTNPRLFGKIWLDAETAQIWRNEFKVVLNPARLSKSVVSEELIYEYQPSEFKILVPKKFVLTTYRISGSGDKDLLVVKDRRMTFEYSKFSEIKTEIQKYEVNK
jgi:hypothetical protein